MYQFKKPVDTSRIPVPGVARLFEEGDFLLELQTLEEGVSGNGKKCLDFGFVVVNGPHAGRFHTESLFIWHDNDKAKEFSIKTMGMILRALNGGVDGQFTGPDLKGKMCVVTRKINGEYNDKPNYDSMNWRPAPTPAPAEAGSGISSAGASSSAVPSPTGDPSLDEDDLGGW